MKTILRRLTAVACAAMLCLTPASALSVEEAVGLLEEYYVDELPAAAYQATTLDELFEAVGDPYTYYMDAAEYEFFSASVEQESTVCGIGAAIEYTAEGVRITQLLDGGGAKDAGLKVGDLIIAIDGVGCVPAEETHRTLITGEEGTYVTLTVRRADGSVEDVRIERRVIQLHNTQVKVIDGVGYIDCDSFGSQTAQYFSDGISENDPDAEHWVVDLRGNPGGFADAAVGTLGTFTGPGRKLFYRFSDGRSFFTLYVGDKLTEKPAVVLVDNMSASASEIFSGGIRAEYAGVVLGGRTYGKGTAQIVLDETNYPEYFDGDCIKITAYRFYCSDGNTTDKLGVLPTLLVSSELTDGVAALLRAEPPALGRYLHLKLNGCDYYVSIDAALLENEAAFAELLSALPPDAAVSVCSHGGEIETTPAELIRQFGAASRAFSDVSDSPFQTEIDTLAVYRLLNGDGTGRFLPGRTMTRAELSAMLTHLLNTSGGKSMGFTDVPAGSWYADSVNTVAGLGFMSGVGNGKFDPYGTLTQEQFIAVMGRLARFLNFHADNHALALDEDDLAAAKFAHLSPWARVEASVMTSFTGNMLYAELADIDPQAPVTREQAAATLCRILRSLDILSY